MFEDIRSLFGQPVEGETIRESAASTPHDLHLAAAVVVLAAAGSDGSISETERRQILQLITSRLSLPVDRAEELLLEATAQKEQSQLGMFVPRVATALDAEQRVGPLAAVWNLIGLDHDVATSEAAFATTLRQQLNLPLEAGIRARKMAENVGVDGFKEKVEADGQVRAYTSDSGAQGILGKKPKR